MTLGDFIMLGDTIFMVGLDGYQVLSMKGSEEVTSRDMFIDRYASVEKQTEEETGSTSASSQELEVNPTCQEEETERVNTDFEEDARYQSHHWALYIAPDDPR